MPNSNFEILLQRDGRDYVREAKGPRSFFDFSANTLDEFIDRYGDDFNLILLGKEEIPFDFYVIPYRAIRHILTPENYANDKKRLARRWTGKIKRGRRIRIDRCSIHLDGNLFYGQLPSCNGDGSEGDAGIVLDAATRRAIELRAVDLAEAHYAGQGYRVERLGKPYDLRCTGPMPEIHVEVKGTTTGGAAVILTPNEVEHARTASCRVDLFVVSGITIGSDYARRPVATGGVISCHLAGWIPKDEDLRPTEFEYRVPSSSQGNQRGDS